ncbi:MAG: YHS domain-containing protein [Alphaproteobacteria bacterium]|nr:YHS domain-containing protein [Alphaproteobacteria bacterium]
MIHLTRRSALIGTAGLVSGLASFAIMPAQAASSPVYSSGGSAIRGVDPVAYFAGNGPVEGKSDFSHEWKGARWLFASAENRDKFAADPMRYAPQYGGYCAFAVAKGKLKSIVPEAWSLVDGKLYLNYSLRVRDKWRKDTADYIAEADANWPGVLSS